MLYVLVSYMYLLIGTPKCTHLENGRVTYGKNSRDLNRERNPILTRDEIMSGPPAPPRSREAAFCWRQHRVRTESASSSSSGRQRRRHVQHMSNY